VVRGGDKRIPELILGELTLGAATDGDQRLVARDLLEAGGLPGGDLPGLGGRGAGNDRGHHGY